MLTATYITGRTIEQLPSGKATEPTKRGHEMAKNMKQGEYGTCFFISALQCQAVMMQGTKGLSFPTDIVAACAPQQGIFVCRFWFLGEWRLVVVDDYLACRKSTKTNGFFSDRV